VGAEDHILHSDAGLLGLGFLLGDVQARPALVTLTGSSRAHTEGPEFAGQFEVAQYNILSAGDATSMGVRLAVLGGMRPNLKLLDRQPAASWTRTPRNSCSVFGEENAQAGSWRPQSFCSLVGLLIILPGCRRVPWEIHVRPGGPACRAACTR